MPAEPSDASGSSGFVCPACGGALWERHGGDAATFDEGEGGRLRYTCRIGHRFEAAQLWIEHCAARNRTLMAAARALAENGALARRLSAWSRDQGNFAAAERLEEEAVNDDGLYDHVSDTLEGLTDHGPRTTG
jgi:two-component system chemotaxis response regulator CheB